MYSIQDKLARPLREIRADYDESSITVYQAYGSHIALPTLAAGRLSGEFNRSRMTWIKPSFLWMMYRSGWATKPGQEYILALTLRRESFDEALRLSAMSQFDPDRYPDVATWREELHAAPVRVQWDPERDRDLRPLPWRSIQIGISPELASEFVDSWTLGIKDVTPFARKCRQDASVNLPVESPYPLNRELRAKLGISTGTEETGVVM